MTHICMPGFGLEEREANGTHVKMCLPTLLCSGPANQPFGKTVKKSCLKINISAGIMKYFDPPEIMTPD